MITERLKEVKKFKLSSGSHTNPEQGACVMEMVSYVAGEPWSDRPYCACPALTKYAINVNDRVDDKTRQKLRTLIPLLAGSKSSHEVAVKRARYLVLQSITVTLPLLTDALKLKDVSKKLRSFKDGEWLAMRDYCQDVARPAMVEAANKHAANAANAANAADAAANAAYYAANAAANAAYYDADYAAYAAANAADYAAANADAAYYAANAAAYANADAAYYAANYAANADAAYAAAGKKGTAAQKAKMLGVRDAINASAIKSLRAACKITK